MFECIINEEGKKQINENVENFLMIVLKCIVLGKGEIIKK